MNRKLSILCFSIWASSPLTGLAQVNLDKPISVGPSDQVFASAVDAKAAYYMPISLDRQSDVTITKAKDRMVARFSVGVNPQLFQSMQKTLAARSPDLQLRVLKPMNPTIELGTDIPVDFTALLTPVNPIDLMGPSEFSLDVDRQYHWIGKDGGEKLFDMIFSDLRRDHVGTVKYEFEAIAKGVPSIAQTYVPVFGGKHLLKNTASLELEITNTQPSAATEPKIQLDRDAHCWDQVMNPGEYCVREK